jgi:DNA-directed RNA polymerase specialized sigma subunit
VYKEREQGEGVDCLIIQSYNDICSKIAALEIWIDSLERDKKYYTKLLNSGAPKDINGINYDGMPKGSRNDMTIDRIIESIHKIESHLYLAQEEKKCKEKAKKDIEEILGKMEGLEYQVFYNRVVKGLTIEKIAEKLNYSESHIKRISAQCGR